MTQSFDEYCKKNQHSGNCTRLEAFSMGQRSRQGEVDRLQAEIDKLQKRIDYLKNWCVSGVECNMLSTEYNQALIDMIKILKGRQNETRFD